MPADVRPPARGPSPARPAGAEGPTTGVPFGRYTLVERLAKGGMGEVHLALAQGPLGISKPCVIKLLLDEFVDDAEQVQRFIEEARILVSLSHRNIVQMLEFGRVKDEYFIAMEYVDGLSLGQLLAARAPLPPEIALFIVREVLSGLAHAHGLQQDGASCAIVHRDISPSNVFISSAGDVKLGDFGLARRPMSPQLTGHGVVVGKLAYMAPELVRREPHTPQSDLYAMGVCLFEMLTGQAYVDLRERDLFQAVDLLRGKRFVPPSSIRPGLPAELDEICARALAPEAARRYSRAASMRKDAQNALAKLAPSTDGEALARLLAQVASPQRKLALPAAPPSSSSDALEPHTVSLAIAPDVRWLAPDRPPEGPRARGGEVPALRLPGMRPFGLLNRNEGSDQNAILTQEVTLQSVSTGSIPGNSSTRLELSEEITSDATLLNPPPVPPATPPQPPPPGVVPVSAETPPPTEADTMLFGPGHRVPTDPEDRPTIKRPPAPAPPPPAPAQPAASATPPPPVAAPPQPVSPSLHTDDTARLTAPAIRRDHLYIGTAVGIAVALALLRLLLG